MPKSVRLRASLTMLAYFILTLAAHQQVSAATITVTNTADSGAGSLRQAVADANATPANDTINFNIPLTDPNCNPSGVCTITLTGGVFTVQAAGGSLTIANQTGAGKLLISGNNASRVFEGGQDANLTLDGLTVTRGVGTSALGVVSNSRGTLTIMNSVFTQNTGSSVVSSSAFGTSGVLNVSNTTVSNNASVGIIASNGGTVGGTVNIVNSTLSNNAATGSGSFSGGGIYFSGDRLTMTNSTISGNSNLYGGGMSVTFSPVTSPQQSIILTNCTVTANIATSSGAGGIDVAYASVKLRNTIVAGNASAGGTPDFNFLQFGGGATSLGNNLIGNATNTGFPRGNWLSSDILNQDARLAPLGNYGGATQTHALLPNSPAINAGNNCVLVANGCGDNNPAVPVDQRGRSRVGTVDIGAFEFAARPAFDFDGDGKSDISVFRPSNGTWYLNRSALGFTALHFGISTDKITPADFDGDGKTDVAVFRDGTWYWINSSNSTVGGAQFGQAGDIPVPADYDGDGRSELAVYRSGIWYMLNLANNQVQVTQFGISTDKPVPADFDGDGKTDLAVYRDGIWYLWRSTAGFTALQFGVASDKPTVGDYDGDGKADLAVYRSGVWYILGSTQGVSAVQFGIPSDIPVAADSDGDGRVDIAVFRPSNGTWYLLQSTNGFYGVQFGANGDQPIEAAYNP